MLLRLKRTGESVLRFDSFERTVIMNRFIKMNQTFQHWSLSLFITDERRRGRILSVCGDVRHMARVNVKDTTDVRTWLRCTCFTQ